MNITMKKSLVIILSLLLSSSLVMRAADVAVYFVDGDNWSAVNVYQWGDNGQAAGWPGTAMNLTNTASNKGAVFQLTVNDSYPYIIFNHGNTQSEDMCLVAETPYYYKGAWYASMEAINDYVEPTDSEVGVPSESEDVILQVFYWDSYKNNSKYGDTKWQTLAGQVNDIVPYFSMVWFPPSASSAGGVGYHPADYSNQSSDWGVKMYLRQLLEAFHEQNTKVIADIVINHAANKSSWCDFYTQNFGSYGTFTPTAAWIPRTDEVNTSASGSCKGKATGAADDGYGASANWAGARDWDHVNPEVQAMFKAYLQWMKNEVHYDGWRYDYCKGFASGHISDYNLASEPEISIMEYWDEGDVQNEINHVNLAQKNSMVFDFYMRAAALKKIASGSYSSLKNAGMRGKGYERYAVTFVDNHDTFARGDGNATDVANKKDGSSINNAALILQANAYILAMPGIPCVFYPHWVIYMVPIRDMVKARRIAGIHSQSTVEEESGSGYYKATITGKHGSVKLFLGKNSGYDTCPAGYQPAYVGNDVGYYFQGDGAWPREGVSIDLSAVEEVKQPVEIKGQKILDNGQLLIKVGDKTYNALGQEL